MDTWALTIAIAVPAVVGSVLACFFRRRAIFWGVLAGALLGVFLKPAESALYDDPLEMLKRRTILALGGTVPCSAGGLMIALIVTRKREP